MNKQNLQEILFSINLKTLPDNKPKKNEDAGYLQDAMLLEKKQQKNTNLKDFEISQNYIAFYDKLEKCNYLLESIISLKNSPKDDRTLDYLLSTGVQDGGQWDLFVNIVNKYGVVPKNAFPETFQSSNTNEIDGLLNKYIRKFAYDIRNNEENIEARKEKA